MSSLGDDAKRFLLERAADAIRTAPAGRAGVAPDDDHPGGPPPGATAAAGVFVTVTVDGELNGCIGTMEPEPLDVAVPRLAQQAAFEDPRLPRLRASEYDRAGIKISVLSPMEPIPASSQEELLAHLRPGVDGLLIRSGWRRATFLPAVWDTLPDPRHFLQQLFAKAGLRSTQWPSDLAAFRYTSEEFGASTRDIAVGRSTAD